MRELGPYGFRTECFREKRDPMSNKSAEGWRTYAEACAFLGNSLLRPMSQTSEIGLDPAFWDAFPDFGCAEVRAAANACRDFAESLASMEPGRAVQQVSVEYTRLFVGPPSPAAPPWETMYRSADATAGFGEATFEMRRLLREAGLQLSNENNQYEDHMGIELLYLSVMSGRVADAIEAAGDAGPLIREVGSFAEERPLSWVWPFRERVGEAFPGGYFSCLLQLAEMLLRCRAER